MKANPPRYTDLDQAISAEVRAEMARQKIKTSHVAEALGMVRATFSDRVNGHQPFTTGDLIAVAKHLGVPAAAITAEAERRLNESNRMSPAA